MFRAFPCTGLLVSTGHPEARQRFASWALRTPLPPIVVAREVAGATVQQSQAHWVNRHVAALERATFYPWARHAHVSSLIDWTREEAKSLLDSIGLWFADARIGEIALRKNAFGDDVEAVSSVANFIASALVPRVDLSAHSTKLCLLKIDAVLESLRCQALKRRPTWLMADSTADVDSDLRRLLSSASDRSVRSGILFVSEWVGWASAGMLKPVPRDLIDQVFLLTSLAPARARATAFHVCWLIASANPRELTDRRRGWLRLALERLFRSPEVVEPDGASEQSHELGGDTKAEAARLLAGLSILEPRNSPWKELVRLAERDPYPEVRRGCEEGHASAELELATPIARWQPRSVVDVSRTATKRSAKPAGRARRRP